MLRRSLNFDTECNVILGVAFQELVPSIGGGSDAHATGAGIYASPFKDEDKQLRLL